MSQPLSLRRLFAGSSTGLERLLEHARHLAELDRRLRRHLPPALADQVSVANYRDGVLVLRTSSAQWRSRVHFLAPQLLEALRAESSIPMVTEIRIRIIPAALQVTIRRESPKLSTASAAVLDSAADAFGDDALGSALRRLAARHRR